MKSIISVSRRSDIPAFHTDWFLEKLKEGCVEVTNPYSQKKTLVSLKPEDVGAFVFWSKNYAPLIEKLEKIETKNLFFHFTITGAKELELYTPEHLDAIKDLIYLSKRYSPERVIWRYDPICITDKLTFELFEERFIEYAEKLSGFVNSCFISFVFPYGKVLANFKQCNDHKLIDITENDKRIFAARLALIAANYGIQLYACCNDYLLSDKVRKASCINGGYLSSIFNTPLVKTKAPTRKECACTKSMDIGKYNTCYHGCLYCYANSSLC